MNSRDLSVTVLVVLAILLLLPGLGCQCGGWG